MRHPLTTLALAVALAVPVAVTAAGPAAAQVIAPPPVTDAVSLNLSVEEWVRTETALVTLVVDAAGNGSDDSGALRANILKAVSGMADKAEWRITRMDSQSDSAGLERWQAQLQARLPESQLSALNDRAKKASRPGLQVRVGNIAFDPTLAETEATRAALRERIYAQVNEELKRLKKAFPERDYRVGGIDFFETSGPRDIVVQGGRVKAEMMAAAPMADVMPGVQDKLVIGARITLSAFAKPPAP